MAILKIYNDINDEEGKNMNYFFTGVDSVCFKDIDAFLSSVPEDDKEIDIRINCRGGLISEGWAMYDKIRSSGKNISVTVEGICASMATVILLAAPVEKRASLPNAQFLIHDPYIPEYTLADSYTAEDLRSMAESLEADTNKLLDLYVERTGSDKDVLTAQMKKGDFLSPSQAKDLGFISTIIMPNTAKFNSKNRFMNKKEVTVKQGWLNKLLAKAGYAKIEDVPAVDLELSTANGETLTIEREEGEPAVGDVASPDGEHVMPDGSTIIVADGVITEIKPAEEEQPDAEALQNRINELEAENARLKGQAKSKDELAILNAVTVAGGKEWLAKQCSHYKPDGKSFSNNKGAQNGPQSKIEKMLEEKRNKSNK